mmetsp:Transcript_17673/g.38891  ORF Transcript_17673/g.38891 Transcript_17673/m.38891 type:complete len:532 (+) Transcript_17673:532-2127(+)
MLRSTLVCHCLLVLTALRCAVLARPLHRSLSLIDFLLQLINRSRQIINFCLQISNLALKILSLHVGFLGVVFIDINVLVALLLLCQILLVLCLELNHHIIHGLLDLGKCIQLGRHSQGQQRSGIGLTHRLLQSRNEPRSDGNLVSPRHRTLLLGDSLHEAQRRVKELPGLVAGQDTDGCGDRPQLLIAVLNASVVFLVRAGAFLLQLGQELCVSFAILSCNLAVLLGILQMHSSVRQLVGVILDLAVLRVNLGQQGCSKLIESSLFVVFSLSRLSEVLLHPLLHLLQDTQNLPGLSVVRLETSWLLTERHPPQLLRRKDLCQRDLLALNLLGVIIQAQITNNAVQIHIQHIPILLGCSSHDVTHLQQRGSISTEVLLQAFDRTVQLVDSSGEIGLLLTELIMLLGSHALSSSHGLLVVRTVLLSLVDLGRQLGHSRGVGLDISIQLSDASPSVLNSLLLVRAAGGAPTLHLVMQLLVLCPFFLRLTLHGLEHVDHLHNRMGLLIQIQLSCAGNSHKGTSATHDRPSNRSRL